MKTKFLSLAVALLLSNFIFAQFHLGIRGGANIVKIDGKSFKEEFSYGYNVGGFAEIGLGKKFSLQPGVDFNQYSTTLDSKFYYQPLSLSFYLRPEYSIGKFYIQPQLILDYYFPASDKQFSSFFSLNTGFIF